MEGIKNQNLGMERMWRMMIYSFILCLIYIFILQVGGVEESRGYIPIVGGMIATAILFNGFKIQKENDFHNLIDGEVPDKRKTLIRKLLKNQKIKDELYILYQPQIDTKSRELVGVEALLRWENSELGNISPVEFIPIAEEMGIIHTIGEIVIEETGKTIKYINEKYGKNIKMGINVSTKQFFSGNIISTLRENIEKNRLNPSWLDIELTESVAMTNDSSFIEKLKEISGLGISISIDDFGTGYSSLAYLKNYPVNTLKIAMELVKDLEKGNDYDYQIVKAVTAMCREMGIETIAEGVESSENFQILKDMGCDRIQGYYFSKPLQLEQLEESFLMQIEYSKVGEIL